MQIAFDLGAKTVTLPRFDIHSYIKAIEDHKVSLLINPTAPVVLTVTF